MELPKGHKTIAVLSIITAVGIILFWVGFFTVGLAPENPPECYFAFENSFPFPDGVMGTAMIAGSVLLLKGSSLGRTLLLVSAGALVFLGLIDFSFNIRHGMYAMSLGDGIMNGFINFWCVFLGVLITLKLKD